MIRTKPLDMQDLARPDFNKINQDYDDTFKSTKWPAVPCRRWEYVAAIVFSEILNIAPEDRHKYRVCDAGSGQTSIFTRYLGAKGFIVDAFDMHTKGHKSFAGGGKITWHAMSMIDVKFENETFDYVFCMSSIEHINAGKFKIAGMDGDTGDTRGMTEISRLLRPGGVLVLTTDYTNYYIPPPGPANSHRVYDWDAMLNRLISPAFTMYGVAVWDEVQINPACEWKDIKTIEPKGMPYTEFILTMKRPV